MRGQKMDQFKEIKEYYLSKYSNHFFVNTIIYPYIEEFLFKAKKKDINWPFVLINLNLY